MKHVINNHDDRVWAAVAHLSGLAGYLLPLGGVIVPIILIFTKSDTPIVSAIAKQALFLNIAVFLCGIGCTIMFITIILIPFAWLLTICVSIIAIAFPIAGAIQAWEGRFFKYPLVGVDPYQ